MRPDIAMILRTEVAMLDVEQRQLAYATGVVPATISQYLSGKRTPDNYVLASMVVEIHRPLLGDEMTDALIEAVVNTKYVKQPDGTLRLRTDKTEPERIAPGVYRDPQTGAYAEVPSESEVVATDTGDSSIDEATDA